MLSELEKRKRLRYGDTQPLAIRCNTLLRIVSPKVAGSSPVGHPSCANLAFVTHCKEAPVFREYGLAPLAHECGVVTGAVMRLL